MAADIWAVTLNLSSMVVSVNVAAANLQDAVNKAVELKANSFLGEDVEYVDGNFRVDGVYRTD